MRQRNESNRGQRPGPSASRCATRPHVALGRPIPWMRPSAASSGNASSFASPELWLGDEGVGGKAVPRTPEGDTSARQHERQKRRQAEFVTDEQQRLLEIEDMRLVVKFGEKRRYSDRECEAIYEELVAAGLDDEASATPT
jgi:hypothetical protein